MAFYIKTVKEYPAEGGLFGPGKRTVHGQAGPFSTREIAEAACTAALQGGATSTHVYERADFACEMVNPKGSISRLTWDEVEGKKMP